MLLSGIFMTAATAINAQSGPISGRVELKKADGTVEPLQGALIEPYRKDIKSKSPSAKTGKKGTFNFLVPLSTYILAISGPGARPTYLPTVRAGSENLVITLEEGDGSRLTEEQVREAVKSGGVTIDGAESGSGDNNKTATKEAGGSKEKTAPGMVEVTMADGTKKTMTEAEADKLKTDIEKRRADVEARNKAAENRHSIVSKALSDGNKAFNEKNYDAAISFYDQGIAADPDFAGSAPTLLNNKATALKIRGLEAYNAGVKASDPAVKAERTEKARKDLADAVEAYNRALEIQKPESVSNVADKTLFEKTKYETLSGLAEMYRLLVATKTPLKDPELAKTAFKNYLAVENDAAKKTKASLTFGNAMLGAGEADSALEAFRSVLSTSADNPDALIGAGLSLVQIGYATDDKTKFQEAADFLQKFISVAPANHDLKDDAVAVLDTLKKEQNVAPQKGGKKK